MKYIFQLGLIIAVSFVGEILSALIPAPVPAGVYGMVIMFLLLHFRIIEFEKIGPTGTFLKNALVVTLIPSAVGVMTAWDVLHPILLGAALLTVASSISTFACSGLTAQAIEKAKRRRGA